MRTALLGQLLAAQAGIAVSIERLMQEGDAASAAQCREQLSTIVALQKSVGAARRNELAALQQFAGSAIATAQTVAQASKGTGNGVSAQLQALAMQTAVEVRAVAHDLFTQRIFDPFLRFASDEDEQGYRRREAENKRYVEEQLAKGTPAGTLNASGATIDQMLDAHEHGAGASPDFHDRWNRVSSSARRHRHAMQAEGHSTKELDQRIDSAVRRFLRGKGLSDAEIEARLAVAGEPLDAVKPYVRSDKDAAELEHTSDAAARLTPRTRPITEIVSLDNAHAPARVEAPSIDDVLSKLRSAELTAAKVGDEPPVHGLDIAATAANRTVPSRP